MRHHRLIVPSAAAACLLLAIPASAAEPSPGAPGIGDSYYPVYGNGGYDVSHYDLRLKYQPKTDRLEGTATILAKASRICPASTSTSRSMCARCGSAARRRRSPGPGDHELDDHPVHGGRLRPVPSPSWCATAARRRRWRRAATPAGTRTPDGGVAANEPESAWWWFPSNDHPLDKATYDISVAVPDGIEAISNGVLTSNSSQLGLDPLQLALRQAAGHLSGHARGRQVRHHDGHAPRTGCRSSTRTARTSASNAGAARASIERTAEIADW